MNVCRWDFPGTWVHDVAFSWRISQDINPSWESVKNIIRQNLYLSAYASEGKYNDMDMTDINGDLLSYTFRDKEELTTDTSVYA
jgi:hypothetical protein